MLMILISTLNVISHLICGNTQNWLLNFNLIYKTLWSGTGSGLLISMLEKLNQFCLMGESVPEEKPSFKILELTFTSKLDLGSYIISIAKTASKKIGALICSIKFFLLGLLHISINLPYDHVWNTVAVSGLVLLIATQNCWINYKNRYAGVFVS